MQNPSAGWFFPLPVPSASDVPFIGPGQSGGGACLGGKRRGGVWCKEEPLVFLLMSKRAMALGTLTSPAGVGTNP